MASGSDAPVYTGFWINWSGNTVTGATLTVQNGAYLVAFLAIVVRAAGRHFWQLLCYAAFYALPRVRGPVMDSARQQRAVLRNSSSAPDGMIKFVRIALRSRNDSRKASSVPLGFAAAAALNISVFVTAAIFSSAVTRTQSDVVLRPSTCGQWRSIKLRTASDWNQETFMESLGLNSAIHRNMVASSQEVLDCRNASMSSQDCGAYGRPPIAFDTYDIPCPFGADVCLDMQLGIALDTGFVDSYSGLGINTAKAERVTMRKKVKCAPLQTNGYSRPVNRDNNTQGSNDSLVGYFYGPNIRLNTSYTFAFNPSTFKRSVGSAVEIPSYQIAVEAASFGPASPIRTKGVALGSSFDPIAELRRSNMVVTLVFLSKQATYITPVNDPWFEANNLIKQNILSSNSDAAKVHLYAGTDPVSVLACTEETLLANSTGGEDTAGLDLVTHVNVSQETFGLHWKKKQVSIVQRMQDNLAYTALPLTIYSLNGNGLLASSYVQYNMGPGLPDSQWQLEVMNWFGTSLNALQAFTVQYVTGYGRDDFNKFLTRPSASEKWMCDHQIVKRDDYNSFSVLGVAIVLIASLAIVLLNISSKKIIPYLANHAGGTKHVEKEWAMYDILNFRQLDRERSVELLPLHARRESSKSRFRSSRFRGVLSFLAIRKDNRAPDNAHPYDHKTATTVQLDSLASTPTSPTVYKL